MSFHVHFLIVTELKSNFLRLEKLVLIGGPADGVIKPWQSRCAYMHVCMCVFVCVYCMCYQPVNVCMFVWYFVHSVMIMTCI